MCRDRDTSTVCSMKYSQNYHKTTPISISTHSSKSKHSVFLLLDTGGFFSECSLGMSHSWRVKISLPSLGQSRLPLSAEILLPPDSLQSVFICLLRITFCWHQSTPGSQDQAMSTPEIKHTRGPGAVWRVCEEEGPIKVSATGQLFLGKGSQLKGSSLSEG